MTGREVLLEVAVSNRDIAHHRTLLIEFDDGKVVKVRLDQGVGYWQLRLQSQSNLWLDFNLDAQDQVHKVAQAIDSAQIQCAEHKWSTDVLIELKG